MHAVVSNRLELLFDKLIERLEKSRPLRPLLIFSSKALSKQLISHMANCSSPMAPMCLSLDEFLDLGLSLFYPQLSPRLPESKRIHLVEVLYESALKKDSRFKHLNESNEKIFASHPEARAHFFQQLSSLIKAYELQGAARLKLSGSSELLALTKEMYAEIKIRGFSTLEDCLKHEAEPLFSHIAFVGFDRLDSEVLHFLKGIDSKALIELYALAPTMHYIADISAQLSNTSPLIAAYGSHKKALQVQLVDFGIDVESYFAAPHGFENLLLCEHTLVNSLVFDPKKLRMEQGQCSRLDAYKMHLAMPEAGPIKMDFSNDISMCTSSFKRAIEEVKGLVAWLRELCAKEGFQKSNARIYLAHPEIYAPLIKTYFEQNQIPFSLSVQTSTQPPRLIDSFLFALSFAQRRWSLGELISLFETPFFLPNAQKKELIEALQLFARTWKFSSSLNYDHRASRLHKEDKDLGSVNVENLSFYTFEAAIQRWAKQMVSASSGLIEQEAIALVIERLQTFFSLLQPLRENARLDEEKASSALLEILDTFFRPKLGDPSQSEFEALWQKIQSIEVLDLAEGVRLQTAVMQLKQGAQAKSVQEKSSGIVVCPLEKNHLMQSDITCLLGFDENALKESAASDFKDLALAELKHTLSFPSKNELFLDLILMTKEALFVSHSLKLLGKSCCPHPGLHLLKNDAAKALFCTKENTFVDLEWEDVSLYQDHSMQAKDDSTSSVLIQSASSPPEDIKTKKSITLYDLRTLLSSPLRWYYMHHLGADPFDLRSPLSVVDEEDNALEIFERGTSLYDGLIGSSQPQSISPTAALTSAQAQSELMCALAPWIDESKNEKPFALELTPLRSTLVFAEQDEKQIAYAPLIETDKWSVTGKVRAALEKGVIALGKMDAKKQWLFASDALALKAAGFSSEILFIQDGKTKAISGDIEKLLQYAEFAHETPSVIYFDTLDLIVDKKAEKLQQKLFDKAFGYQPDSALAHYLTKEKDLNFEELIEKLHPSAKMLKEMVYE